MRRAFLLPPGKEGHMVTYEDLFQFVIMLMAVAAFVWDMSKKK